MLKRHYGALPLGFVITKASCGEVFCFEPSYADLLDGRTHEEPKKVSNLAAFSGQSPPAEVFLGGVLVVPETRQSGGSGRVASGQRN